MRTRSTILKYTKLLKTTQLEATEFCTKVETKNSDPGHFISYSKH